MTASPSSSQQVPRAGASSDLYDEERTRWGSDPQSPRRPKKYIRILTLSKSSIYLFLVDAIIIGSLVWLFAPLITLLLRNEELFGARLTFSGNISQSDGVKATIPRILHQTTANETIPEAWKAAQQSCKNTYSNFEYKHWTDASARDFIASNYAWFLQMWDDYPFGIQRADAIRYFILDYYGGMYIDMDTICAEPIPFEELEANEAAHLAVFKSTKPTGISNDLMIATKHHPALDVALSKILAYSRFTQPWARWIPYCAIMISAGPLFITMAVKNYLLDNPSIPPATVQVVNATTLQPYITDLEAASWHHEDAQFFMFLGERPWIWLLLASIGVILAFRYINRLLLAVWRRLSPMLFNADASKRADAAKEVKMS